MEIVGTRKRANTFRHSSYPLLVLPPEESPDMKGASGSASSSSDPRRSHSDPWNSFSSSSSDLSRSGRSSKSNGIKRHLADDSPMSCITTPCNDDNDRYKLGLSTTSTNRTAMSMQRPATPSRRKLSFAGSSLEPPERPQSAMKHKSAHEYSSGKSVETVFCSPDDLPGSLSRKSTREEEMEDDADALIDRNGRVKPAVVTHERLAMKGESENGKSSTANAGSDATLPRNSFYERIRRKRLRTGNEDDSKS